MNNVDPWYITGFIDGEGSFVLHLNTETKKRKNNLSIYKYWITTFAVELRLDDKDVLDQIADYFSCGHVGIYNPPSYQKLGRTGKAHFHLRSRKDQIAHILPHFDKYPLQAKKRIDYKLWREAVLILGEADKRRTSKFDSQSLTKEEENRLVEIRELLAERLTLGHKANAVATFNKRAGKSKLMTLV